MNIWLLFNVYPRWSYNHTSANFSFYHKNGKKYCSYYIKVQMIFLRRRHTSVIASQVTRITGYYEGDSSLKKDR